MSRRKKPKFEDLIEQIDLEIRKRKSKWNLTALAWMDFDDVSQILRIPIVVSNEVFDLIGNYTINPRIKGFPVIV